MGGSRNFEANARAYLGALDEETQDRVVAHYVSGVPPQAVGSLRVGLNDVHQHLVTSATQEQQRDLLDAMQQARRKSLTTMIGLDRDSFFGMNPNVLPRVREKEVEEE